jgi:hypothetical protein
MVDEGPAVAGPATFACGKAAVLNYQLPTINHQLFFAIHRLFFPNHQLLEFQHI